MNKKQRKDIAHAFALTHEYLSNIGGWRHICEVLQGLFETRVISQATFHLAKKTVQDRLAPPEDHFLHGMPPTYSGWVYVNHYDVYKNAMKHGELDKLQREGRILWLESLIREFSK